VACRLTYVETAAAKRGGRLNNAQHAAALALLDDNDLVAATGDARLLRAWAALGIATYDPTGSH
jgi:hypothetical protein